jgi:DNA-binding HxlR family transcriptional regulator
VGAFRYAQFCPLARALELLGERWTLLVIRELLLGPQRFTDLRQRLPGVSSSVLASRLARLEERELVIRRELPPPAASLVYELGEAGRALLPAVIEIGRWGTRFLLPGRPGDHVEPDWLRLALRIWARRGPSPARSIELRVRDGGREIRIAVAGGPRGTTVADGGAARPDAVVRLEAPAAFALMAGLLDLDAARHSGALALEGDAGALADLPALFEVDLGTPDRRGAPQGRAA